MAQFNLSQITNQGAGDRSQIGFFNLKNDKEEAVVRFMYDDAEELKVLTVHQVMFNGKYRKVNCLRESAGDPADVCPLCESGLAPQQRIFIRMLKYEKAADGSIVAVPCIWERSVSYAYKLLGYIQNYGPLSDLICKIQRHGAPGDMKTEYEIIPNLSKSIYPDTVYTKLTDAFKDYNPLGTVVFNKNAEEIKYFLSTGQWPNTQATTNSTDNGEDAFNTPINTPAGNTQYAAAPTNVVPPEVMNTVQAQPEIPAVQIPNTTQFAPAEGATKAPAQNFPWEQKGITRPVRYN